MLYAPRTTLTRAAFTERQAQTQLPSAISRSFVSEALTKVPREFSFDDDNPMHVSCPICFCYLGWLNPGLGGRPAKCEECGGKFILPIPDPDRLLEWVNSAPWDDLEEGIRTNIGKGHSPGTVTRLVQLFERRRRQKVWRHKREEYRDAISESDASNPE